MRLTTVSFALASLLREIDDRSLLAQWKPSYKRGFAMQASLAILSAVFGAAASRQTGDGRWLVGALLIVANWPYTLLAIMPTNTRLMAKLPEEAGAAERTLVRRWGRLRAGRTALGLAAVLAFLWALNAK